MRRFIALLLLLLAADATAQTAARSGRQTIGSDLSTFTFTPNGATGSRQLGPKLGDVISAKDPHGSTPGALGDGSDDTAAVTAAVTAAGDIARVYFPCPGTYHTTTYGDITCTGPGGRDRAIGAESATQQIVSKLLKGSEDAFITVISDSTAYTSNYLTTPTTVRWVSRFGTGIGAKFRAYTVKLNEWDDTSKTYLGWATLQTGSGGQTLWISNASFTGVSTQYVLGSNLALMVTATTPDLVIISHGHNEGTITTSWGPDMIGMAAEVSTIVPNASILIVGQNPQSAPASNPGNQTLRVARYQEVAGRMGWGFLNVYQAFIDYSTTWATDLLNADGIHPNDTGSQLWADETLRAFTYRKYGEAPSRQPSGFSTPIYSQILVNGNFSEWDGTAPTHWVQNFGTTTQDTTNYENANGYATKITTTAQTAYLAQAMPVSVVKGQCVTVSGRIYVATGQPLNTGWLFINDNTGSSHATVTTYGQGAFRWKVVQRCFATTITSAEVRIYGDASTTSGVATWDRVSAVMGMIPYDVPMVRDAIRIYRVKADFTTAANTSLQAITGLTWTTPPLVTGATGTAFPFDCHLLYSQATANAAVAFGEQSGVTMANLNAEGIIRTSATAFTAGNLIGQTANTANAIVTATPSAIATTFGADLHGVQEQTVLNTLNSMQIMVSTATAADAVTVLRGSYCLVKFN